MLYEATPVSCNNFDRTDLAFEYRTFPKNKEMNFYKIIEIITSSFRGQQGTENDMRFVYCAIAICYILNDFSRINMKSVLKFIQRCVNFDGGIGQAPSLESHG